MPWKLDGVSTDNNLFQGDVETNRLKNVHYVRGGNPDGLPVVFLHDNLASSRWWEAAQEALPYRYQSIAPDLRGFGLTEYKPVNSMQDFVDDIHDFLGLYKLPPFVLVGWGMGGGIAMLYGLQHPEHVRAMVLVNSISPKGHRPMDRSESIDELARALSKGNRNEVAAYLRHYFFRSGNFPVGDLSENANIGSGPLSDEAAFEYILAGTLQARNYNWSEQEGIFHAMRVFDIHTQVASLPFPVFTINGGNDAFIRPEEAREVDRYLANEKYQRDGLTIPNCGHSPMVELPNEFMQALAGYLGRLNWQQVVHASTTEAARNMAGRDITSGSRSFGAGDPSSIAYDKND
ncbi:MAG TPA: alpha/beta hydrolase [Chloroflexia bacterium]|nr:alpha/beta hydrolase [Chloroflexia bacterium]